MPADFALLLPITSRGSGGVGIRSGSDVEVALKEFCESLKKTSSQSDLDSIKVFFGVDTGDPLLDITKNDPRDCREDVIARVFEDEAIAWERIICEVEAPSKRPEHGTLSDAPLPAKGQVCRVWRELTKTAFGQGVSYAVLVGDDVRFLSAGWTSEIKAEFSALHREAFTPFGAASASIPEGFGVLCFTDVGSPGFPGFPVLHRTHLDIFGEIFPAAFINQDADPWIFQVYLRFGAARLMPNATLVNTVGGCQGDASSHAVPRYRKVAIDWKTKLLEEGVGQVRAWLNSRLLPPTPPNDRYPLFQPFVILDVLVPSVRNIAAPGRSLGIKRLDDLTVLRKICSLKVPDFMRTSFIVIIDDPSVEDKTIRFLTQTLQQEAAPNACRVRKNQVRRCVGSRFSSAGEKAGTVSDGHPRRAPAGGTQEEMEEPAAVSRGPFATISANVFLAPASARCVIFPAFDTMLNERKFNIGAGPSRNRALDESSADFVLFLDDDVHPAADLLQVYGNAIQTRFGNECSAGTTRLGDEANKRGICGFIGKTAFPPTETSLQRAVLISDVTYMYGISDAIAYPAWGVTANLLVKVASARGQGGGAQRSTTRFGDNFPKTGGGEDVDFCLRHQRDTGGTFAALPSAIVTHPWWSGDRLNTYRRFAKWSSGDGQLMDLHPEFAYRDVPNVAESMILAPFLTLIFTAPFNAASFLGNCASAGAIMAASESNASRALHSFACNLSHSSRAGGSSSREELTRLIAATLAAPLAVLLSEMACDIYRNVFDQTRRKDRLPALNFLARVAAAAEASLVITALEFGRLWGHWARGGVIGLLTSFGRRFDWHCSRLAGARESERNRSRSKIVFHVIFVASAWSLVMHA